MAFRVALCFLPYWAAGLSPQTQPEDSSLPQCDFRAETEIKRAIDEVNLLSLGTRKAFGEPIIKNGDDKVHIYLCAKPFQEEMGISLKKGGQIPGATSKVKQDLSDGGPRSRTDEGRGHAFARDDKIKPVWHWRTSK
jgi:hypothetical protein